MAVNRKYTAPIYTTEESFTIFSEDIRECAFNISQLTRTLEEFKADGTQGTRHASRLPKHDYIGLKTQVAKLVVRLGVTIAEIAAEVEVLANEKKKERDLIEIIEGVIVDEAEELVVEAEEKEIIKAQPESPKNAVLAHYYSYNFRRYSLPWVCQMLPDGKHDFSAQVGTYTGDAGNEGDLVVFDPKEGQVYGYGQKDNRGNNTLRSYARYTNGEFIPCDKLGRPL